MVSICFNPFHHPEKKAPPCRSPIHALWVVFVHARTRHLTKLDTARILRYFKQPLALGTGTILGISPTNDDSMMGIGFSKMGLVQCVLN